MADGYNKAILIGNLGADPELRVTQNGSAVMNMRIATSETYLDHNKQRQERTEWHNVVVWGRRAEGLAKFLTKGHKVMVEGPIRTNSYEDRDGNKRYSVSVHAFEVLVLRDPGTGGGQRSDRGDAYERQDEEQEAPRGWKRQERQGQRSQSREPSDRSYDYSRKGDDSDDIPF